MRLKRSNQPSSPLAVSQNPSQWSPTLLFGIIILMSAVFSIREMKAYNALDWVNSMRKNEEDSLLPSSSALWKAQLGMIKNETEKAPMKVEISGELPDNKTALRGGETSNITKGTIIPLSGNKSSPILPNDGNVTEFKRYDRVVIATKIHGPHQWKLVLQSMCLLHSAYNHKVLYDIVVFTADPEIPKQDIEHLEKLMAPAKISFVMDNIGLQEEIAALTPAKHELFLKRCNVTDPVNLTWWDYCEDPKGGLHRLNYNWQAEFRSVRIWSHPALEKYKYMLWLDSDGFPSREWEKDPVAYFIENGGVIMFDNFPQGAVRASDKNYLLDIADSFNGTALCDLRLDRSTGQLTRKLINRDEFEIFYDNDEEKKKSVDCRYTRIGMIHGFMHITDLDFYRQPKVLDGLNKLLGDCFLCRRPDDQLAVTLPAAIYAPEKSWDMRLHGFDLKVFHNGYLDGESHEKAKPPGFVRYWNDVAKEGFPSAAKVCKVDQRS